MLPEVYKNLKNYSGSSIFKGNKQMYIYTHTYVKGLKPTAYL